MKIKHDPRAYEALLKSEAMRAELASRAKRIAAAAGPGFEATSTIGRRTALASVRTTDVPSIRRNSRDNTLIRAIEAGRDA
jgi:hypothetical protein